MQAVDFGEDAEPELEDAQMAEQAGEEALSGEGEAALAGAATTEPAEAAGSAVAQPAEPAAADHPVAAAEAANATAVSDMPAAPGGDAAASDAAAGAPAATEAEPAAEQAIPVFIWPYQATCARDGVPDTASRFCRVRLLPRMGLLRAPPEMGPLLGAAHHSCGFTL